MLGLVGVVSTQLRAAVDPTNSYQIVYRGLLDALQQPMLPAGSVKDCLVDMLCGTTVR
jgi:hypothetical protein